MAYDGHHILCLVSVQPAAGRHNDFVLVAFNKLVRQPDRRLGAIDRLKLKEVRLNCQGRALAIDKRNRHECLSRNQTFGLDLDIWKQCLQLRDVVCGRAVCPAADYCKLWPDRTELVWKCPVRPYDLEHVTTVV